MGILLENVLFLVRNFQFWSLRKILAQVRETWLWIVYTKDMEWLRRALAPGQRAPFPEWSWQEGEESSEVAFATLLAHFDLHQSQGHRSCARDVLELARHLTAGNPDFEYRWLRKWARWLESAGRREESLELLNQHLGRLRGRLSNPTRNADLRMELGILSDRAGLKAQALEHFREAARRYRKLNHTYNYVAALFNSASVYHDLHQFGEALKTCRRALREGAGSYRDLNAHILLQVANSREAQAHKEVAFESYRQAEDAYGMLGNRRQQGDILYRLGWMAVKSRRLNEGMAFLRQSLELKRELDYACGLAWYHWSRAEAYRSGGLVKKAISYYRSALNLALASHQDRVAAQCRVRLFYLCARPDQSLIAFVRFGNASAVESIVRQGRAGLYLDHVSDGFNQAAYREAGDSPRGRVDRRVLGRLVSDLEKVTRATGVEPSASLKRQCEALQQWLKRESSEPR